MKKYILIIIFGGTIAFSQYWEDVVETFYQIPSVGIRSHAMGDAFVAGCDDYSALYSNPAGLANINYFEISGGIFQRKFQTDVNVLEQKFQSKISKTGLDGFAFVMPLSSKDSPVTFGFGYFTPVQYQYISEFLQDGDEKNYLTSGQMTNGIAACGFQLNKQLNLGGSISFIGGKNAFVAEENGALDESNYEYSGTSIEFGLQYKMDENLKFGWKIRSPQFIAINEEWAENDSIWNFDYEMIGPARMNAGIFLKAGWITLLGEIEYVDWTQMKLDTYDIAWDTEENRLLRQNLYANSSIKTGFEFLLPIVDLRLRGGIQYLPTPYLENAEDRTIFSGGYGILLDSKVEFNGAYSFATWKQIQADDVMETYQTHRFVAGLSFRF